MNISASTFSTNLATLTISVVNSGGLPVTLKIRSVADLKKNPVIEGRDCPLLVPAYTFQTNLQTPRESMGEDAFRSKDWTANYRLIFCPVGGDRTGLDVNYMIVDCINSILAAVVAVPTTLGVNDVAFSGSNDPNIIEWVNGDKFYAADFQLAVEDFRNL